MAHSSARITGRGMLRVVQQLQHARGSSLPARFSPQLVHKSTDSKILSRSSLLLQDGLDIQELPIVIRKLEAAMLPMTNSYTASDIRDVSERDAYFWQELQDCSNVKQVFELLEVPAEQVTGYSAAFALQRLCQLHERNADGHDTFIKTAILHELCDTTTKEIKSVSSETLLGLVRCYLKADYYSHQFVELVNEEVEKRIGDSKFTIIELCNLIELLSEHLKGDQNIVKNVFIHLGNRFTDITEENIARVYHTMLYGTPDLKYMFKILGKQVQMCWWKLGSSDVARILKVMRIRNDHSVQNLTAFGKWLFMNVHDVTDKQLKDIISAYSHFSFGDPNLIQALERYVAAKVGVMDKTVVGMVMDYCRGQRLLSLRIFDAVADDFVKNGDAYEPLDMFYTLRPFGQLNYLPRVAAKFFTKIEDRLMSRFPEFIPTRMVELLASFVYLERFPINFVDKVFTPHFLARVQGFDKSCNQQVTSSHLMQLLAAFVLELPRHNKFYINRVTRTPLSWSMTWLEGLHFKFHQEVGIMLLNLLGLYNFKEAEIPKNTPHFINYEILVDQNKKPVNYKKQGKVYSSRLALVTVMPEHHCINTGHLLGDYAMRNRHLKLLGYTVIPVEYDEFRSRKRVGTERVNYIQSLLEPHMSLDKTS